MRKRQAMEAKFQAIAMDVTNSVEEIASIMKSEKEASSDDGSNKVWRTLHQKLLSMGQKLEEAKSTVHLQQGQRNDAWNDSLFLRTNEEMQSPAVDTDELEKNLFALANMFSCLMEKCSDGEMYELICDTNRVVLRTLHRIGMSSNSEFADAGTSSASSVDLLIKEVLLS